MVQLSGEVPAQNEHVVNVGARELLTSRNIALISRWTYSTLLTKFRVQHKEFLTSATVESELGSVYAYLPLVSTNYSVGSAATHTSEHIRRDLGLLKESDANVNHNSSLIDFDRVEREEEELNVLVPDVYTGCIG